MMKRLLAAVMVLVAALAVGAAPASADPGDKSFNTYVKTQVHISGSGYDGSGVKVPSNYNYEPPKCWYEPRYTYAAMRDWAYDIYFAWRHMGPEDQYDASEWYQKTLAEIAPHEAEPGKIFWFLTDDGTDAGWDCYIKTDPFWKYVGATPPIDPDDNILDPIDLQKIARANLTVPKPTVQIYPGRGTTFVGLETWVQVDNPGPLNVVAEIPGTALRAEITATPGPVQITASGGDFTTQDGRANCPAYTKGASMAEGCWIRFNKSSLGAAYTITVTRTWTVTAQGGPLDETGTDWPSFVSPPMVVDEIQSIVGK